MILPRLIYMLLHIALRQIRSTVSADLLVHAQMPMSHMYELNDGLC